MAQAEPTVPVSTKSKKTPAEKKEARATLIQLLTIIILAVGVIYLGMNIFTLGLGIVVWFGGFLLGRS